MEETTKRSRLANYINGVTGEKEIPENWKLYCSNLLNSSKGSYLTGTWWNCLILKLEKVKAPGLDGLSNEALVYAGARLSVVLALCYSSILLHGILPSTIIQTVIIPLVNQHTWGPF